MPLIDWAARWRPVEGHQPCRVWIPSSTRAAPAAPPGDAAHPPREITLSLAGMVHPTGGSRSLRAQLGAVAVTPEHVRHDVLGRTPPAQRQAPAAHPVPTPQLSIPRQRQGDPCQIELAGELDISNAARHRARLDELLATPVREVEVDLSDVTFMDLTTLRILLQADAQLRARGGRLRLLNPCRLVRRLLAITATEHLMGGDARPAKVPEEPMAARALAK